MSDSLSELAKEVATILGPTAASGPKRANLTSAIMTAFRPYVEHAVTGTAPKAVRDGQDKRVRKWLVSWELWTVGVGGQLDVLKGAAEGREAGKEAGRYGGDICTGLDDAAAWLSDVAAQLGAYSSGDDFTPANLSRALYQLRPTISRQGGHATMRRTSADGRWHLIADVFREDAFPKE